MRDAYFWSSGLQRGEIARRWIFYAMCYFMIYPMGSDSGVRRKFHEGVSFNGIWWSFVCVQFL